MEKVPELKVGMEGDEDEDEVLKERERKMILKSQVNSQMFLWNLWKSSTSSRAALPDLQISKKKPKIPEIARVPWQKIFVRGLPKMPDFVNLALKMPTW